EPRLLLGHDPFVGEPLFPEFERAFGNGEGNFLRFAGAVLARRHVFPKKKGQRRAGRADLVAEIKVPGAGIIEIDRALDEAQPQRAAVEGDMPLRLAGDRRDVMDTRTPRHRSLPKIEPSAPNPKFAPPVPQGRLRTSGSKGALEL